MSRELPRLCQSRTKRALRTLAVGVLCLTLGFSAAPSALADEYDDQRVVRAQMAQQRVAIDRATSALAQKVDEADAARRTAELATTELAQARAALTMALEADQQKAAALEQAQAALGVARQKLAAAKQAVADERARMGEIARGALQQNSGLESIATLVTANSTAQLADRLQWYDTLTTTSDAKFDHLTDLLAQQATAEQQMADARAAAEQAKTEAAHAVVARRDAQAQADAKAAAATEAARRADAAQADAESDLDKERRQMAELEAEDQAVSQRIKQRIAREKAAAEARARAAAVAKAKAEAEARAKAKAKAKAEAKVADNSPQKPSTSSNKPSTSAEFIRPLTGGRITSPFGMRFHPVLHVWALHDGVDFASSCGAPVYAVADGVVTDRYTHRAWGNRVIISHGQWKGEDLATGYAHLSSFNVSVGQHVKKGDIVGYEGATGYATGCHVHFSVWLNGDVKDAMKTIFAG